MGGVAGGQWVARGVHRGESRAVSGVAVGGLGLLFCFFKFHGRTATQAAGGVTRLSSLGRLRRNLRREVGAAFAATVHRGQSLLVTCNHRVTTV